ncbi:MAG: HEPN domain-containing protein [Hydrogenophaga sp.]|nr:HEPN domain-containing protein [Hydrogenophaga sp.]
MTLANLLAIQRLQAFETSPQAVQRLLAAAERNLNDAQLQALSAENRFDAACKCILQCATLGLWAQCYRTPSSQPGHHQTTLQCLPLTMGLPNDVIIVLDALRKQRNQNDYEGDSVNSAVVTECIEQAHNLLAHTRQFLQTQYPHLLR